MKRKDSKGLSSKPGKHNDSFTAAELKETNSKLSESEKDIPEELNYPPSEDITRQAKKEHLDVEYITRSGKYSEPPAVPNDSIVPDNIIDDEIRPVPGTEADVTKEDLRTLELTDGMTPTSKLEELDQELNEESDLDIPGAELDDKDEILGEEDEENNYYSLGGDRHDDLEEDPS